MGISEIMVRRVHRQLQIDFSLGTIITDKGSQGSFDSLGSAGNVGGVNRRSQFGGRETFDLIVRCCHVIDRVRLANDRAALGELNSELDR
jgi:hypothetical protein